MGTAVLTEGLTKRYRGRGGRVALDGFDLAVAEGTVHGLLGLNGAGKTTAVRILTTLLRPDAGRAVVAGHDVVAEPAQVRRRIGLVGQHVAVDEVLDGRANLVMFGRLYHLTRAEAVRRAAALLERFCLADAGDLPVERYSGGMRRRLGLAASLTLAPAVLFLDEPTTGLDPQGRAEVWQAVRGLVADGTTVLLTTQYLDEADQLTDHISVLAAPGGSGGRVIAEGSPDDLRARIGGDRIEVVVRHAADLARAAALVGRASAAEPDVDADRRCVGAPVRDRTAALREVVRALDDEDVDAEDVVLRRPTLDEVFLRLTGDRTEAAA